MLNKETIFFATISIAVVKAPNGDVIEIDVIALVEAEQTHAVSKTREHLEDLAQFGPRPAPAIKQLDKTTELSFDEGSDVTTHVDDGLLLHYSLVRGAVDGGVQPATADVNWPLRSVALERWGRRDSRCRRRCITGRRRSRSRHIFLITIFLSLGVLIGFLLLASGDLGRRHVAGALLVGVIVAEKGLVLFDGLLVVLRPIGSKMPSFQADFEKILQFSHIQQSQPQ